MDQQGDPQSAGATDRRWPAQPVVACIRVQRAPQRRALVGAGIEPGRGAQADPARRAGEPRHSLPRRILVPEPRGPGFQPGSTTDTQVLSAGLDLLAGLSTYSLRELVGTLLALHRPSLRGRDNLLAQEGALYCSAMVQHCYAAAGIEFIPGVATKNLSPHDIATSRLPHSNHALVRDDGESSLRRLARRGRELLRSE